MNTSKSDIQAVLDHDRAKSELVRLSRRWPDRARAASDRITEQIRRRTEKELAAKRDWIRRQLELKDLARDTILHGEQDTRGFSHTERRLFDGFVSVFEDYGREHGNLDGVPALEAYLTDYAVRYQAAQVEHGEVPSPTASLINARRDELDPDKVEIATHKPAFQLAIETKELMRQDPDRIRTEDGWWEVAVLVLCVEAPEVSALDLGLGVDLSWGDWEMPGGDLFDHRDGMRTYIDRGPNDQEKDRNDELFWLLAERAAAWLAGPPDTDDAGEARSSVTARSALTIGTPLVGWKEICDAINVSESRSKRDWLKRLNDLTLGPITWVGDKPEVDKIELIAWIDDRDGRALAVEKARKSRKGARQELQERGGQRQPDYGMHSEKRPNAKGRVGPAPPDDRT